MCYFVFTNKKLSTYSSINLTYSTYNSNNVMSEYAKNQDKYATNLEKVLEVYR